MRPAAVRMSLSGTSCRLYARPAGTDDSGRYPLERRGSEELPAVTLEYAGPLTLGHRGECAAGPLLLLDQPAGLGRRIEKQRASGLRAGALPGMAHAARQEGAAAGAADRDLVADQEGDLAAQHIGHLVAVVMQVEGALGPDGKSLLEHHETAVGLVPPQLERENSAGRRGVLCRRCGNAGRAHR